MLMLMMEKTRKQFQIQTQLQVWESKKVSKRKEIIVALNQN